MDEKTLKIKYDRAVDVLYCSFGDPVPALSVERDHGIVIRLDPDTDKVVGVTVVDFFKRFADHPEQSVDVPLMAAAG